MAISGLMTIEDYEEATREKLFPYTWSWLSLSRVANKPAYTRYYIRPHVLRDVSNLDTTTTLLGHRVPVPIGVAPTAFHCWVHPDGEIATARGTHRAGMIMTQSTYSSKSIEEVSEGCREGARWMQLQPIKDRSVTADIVQRAEQNGYKAIVVTCDDPILVPYGIQMKRPSEVHTKIGNFSIDYQEKYSADAMKFLVEEFVDPTATWEWVDWLRSITTLPIVLKGIQRADDAREAITHDIQAIQVSNHGGRRLSGCAPTLDVLPEIVEAVGGKVEVYVDGGVRHGTDVFKALALGARAVFMGRPIIWGLACEGEDGVYNVLKIMKEEFSQTMALSGCSKLSDITRDMISS